MPAPRSVAALGAAHTGCRCPHHPRVPTTQGQAPGPLLHPQIAPGPFSTHGKQGTVLQEPISRAGAKALPCQGPCQPRARREAGRASAELPAGDSLHANRRRRRVHGAPHPLPGLEGHAGQRFPRLVLFCFCFCCFPLSVDQVEPKKRFPGEKGLLSPFQAGQKLEEPPTASWPGSRVTNGVDSALVLKFRGQFCHTGFRVPPHHTPVQTAISHASTYVPRESGSVRGVTAPGDPAPSADIPEGCQPAPDKKPRRADQRDFTWVEPIRATVMPLNQILPTIHRKPPLRIHTRVRRHGPRGPGQRLGPHTETLFPAHAPPGGRSAHSPATLGRRPQAHRGASPPPGSRRGNQ